jgi:enterochelin esterase-like enzyme
VERDPASARSVVFGCLQSPREENRGVQHHENRICPCWSPARGYYELIVDGWRCNDPASESYFGWGQQTSGLEVPDADLSFYEAKAVPHGEVRTLWYQSKITRTMRRTFVYTPPDYESKPQQRYPVLYLQHGAGESERAWTAQGTRGNEAFGDLVVCDLVPLIDSRYRTIADRNHRAIAGLSMGAGQALQIGLGNPDLFSKSSERPSTGFATPPNLVGEHS